MFNHWLSLYLIWEDKLSLVYYITLAHKLEKYTHDSNEWKTNVYLKKMNFLVLVYSVWKLFLTGKYFYK